MSWDTRMRLLDEMRHLDSMRPVREAFEAFKAVGASRPVRLTLDQKGGLLEVIEFWMNQVGVDQLPEGVFDQRNALHDDLHDAMVLAGRPTARRSPS
jgi:hypothetical protein